VKKVKTPLWPGKWKIMNFLLLQSCFASLVTCDFTVEFFNQLYFSITVKGGMIIEELIQIPREIQLGKKLIF